MTDWCINSTLPAEVLEKIFKVLPRRDLKTAVKVCRRWREVGEQPGLWSWVTITVHLGNLARVPAVLSNRRLRCMKGLHLQVVSEELLEAVVRHPGLKLVDMVDCNLFVSIVDGKRSAATLASVDHNLLGSAITNCEEVKMNMKTSNRGLSRKQALEIFSKIAAGSSLKRLQLSHVTLDDCLTPDLFTRSLCQLESIQLEKTSLSNKQLGALFDQMAFKSKLTHLDLSGSGSLTLVPISPLKMVASLSRLESLGLGGTSLSSTQLEVLCSTWANSTPSLKHLDLSHNKLSSVPARHLAEIALHIESLNLRHSNLTSEQSNELCTAVMHSRSLTSFDFSHNNLSHVNWLVMQRLVAKVERAALDFTELTNTLTWRLLGGLPSTRMKSLSIAGVDLSAVEAKHFGRVVAQLEEVNLEDAKLTPEQVLAIFASLDASSSLHTLKIGGNRLALVPPEQMARVVNKMKVVSMSTPETPPGHWPRLQVVEKLTVEHLQAMLSKSLEGTSLTSLSLGPVANQGRINTELIEKATKIIGKLSIPKESRR